MNNKKPPQVIYKEEQMPQYITKKPWYSNNDESESNNNQNLNTFLSNKFQKPQSIVLNPTIKGFLPTQVNKYRQGACENCGAMTHKKKDCFERPRAKGAKWTNQNIQSDEFIKQEKLDYDGKHDTWNNYDPNTQISKVLQYEYLEELKLKEQLENDQISLKEEEAFDDDILESKEKSLLNKENIIDDCKNYMLDLNADGKTKFHLKNSGDAQKFLDTDEFLNRINEDNKELQLNLISNPTQGEMYKKYYEQQVDNITKEKRKLLADLYGSDKNNKVPTEFKVLLDNKHIDFTELGADNTKSHNVDSNSIIRKAMCIRGHVSAFGSLYDKISGWGYKCCRSYDIMSICSNK